LYGETDQIVAEKIGSALRSSIRVIACLGETFEERKADQTVAVVTRQLKAIVGMSAPSNGCCLLRY
jgi:triosephosphate isomerase